MSEMDQADTDLSPAEKLEWIEGEIELRERLVRQSSAGYDFDVEVLHRIHLRGLQDMKADLLREHPELLPAGTSPSETAIPAIEVWDHERVSGFLEQLPRGVCLPIANYIDGLKARKDRLEDAMWKIHGREWASGDERAGARHAAEMWAIADTALGTGSV